MFKLVYITNGLSVPGGLERVLSVKASYLAEHYEYEVHIITLNEEGKKPFYEFSSKIIMHTIGVNGNAIQYIWRYVTGIHKVLKTIQPNVILVCDDGFKGFFLPIVIGKPCPMIYERHVSKLIAINDDNARGIRNVMVRSKFILMDLLAKTFDCFVLLTSENKKEWNLKNLIVIPNPTSFYPKEISTGINKIVIAVGKQGYQKGYDRLLYAWELVNHKHPEWKLEIYGRIQPEQKLEELSKVLNLNNTVSFFSPVKDIQSKYFESSIYVMSSRFEGLPMVLIEAMAYGLPCISFNCPFGPADIINNGIDGFLVKNGDVQTMAEKIIFLIENEDIRNMMGIAARENIKRYLPENIMPQWDNLFKTLIQNNHAGHTSSSND